MTTLATANTPNARNNFTYSGYRGGFFHPTTNLLL